MSNMKSAASCIFYFTITLYFLINSVTTLESENIIGNLYAKEDQFKYHISLHVDGISICGGSLIADNIVLTAGHCVCNKNGKIYDLPYKVVAGTVNLDIIDITEDVVKVYMLEGYTIAEDGSVTNDIAVLRLKNNLKINNNPHLSTLKLPKYGEDYSGKDAIIAGFGWISFKRVWNEKAKKYDVSGDMEKRLKYVNVRVLSDRSCLKYRNKFICAQAIRQYGKEYRGVCTKDSGGSLVYEDTVIGVLSSGQACDETIVPAVYTKVSLFLDFIIPAMKDERTSNMITLEPTQSIVGGTFSALVDFIRIIFFRF